MTVETFFDLFVEELKQNPSLQGYYRFLNNPQKFEWRKAYFCQRLQYIIDHIDPKTQLIWDCGCGYGTTAIFLALNGYKVHGSTLEFYYEDIENHINYWSQHGDVSGFSYNYEDVLSTNVPAGTYDVIIIQDTMHHLEPMNEVLSILSNALAADGTMILIEENGNNIVQNLKLFKQRGFKRIKRIYDEKLKKSYLMGDENIRGINKWKRTFEKAGFVINDAQTEYVRYFYPSKFNKSDSQNIILREKTISSRSLFLRKYFFFGLSFTISRKTFD